MSYETKKLKKKSSRRIKEKQEKRPWTIHYIEEMVTCEPEQSPRIDGPKCTYTFEQKEAVVDAKSAREAVAKLTQDIAEENYMEDLMGMVFNPSNWRISEILTVSLKE